MRAIAKVVVVLVCITGISFGGTYGGGSGTEADPYLIWTAEQMNEIGANADDWDKHFILMSDIDLGGYTGTSYNRIGTEAAPFMGQFDGDGHTISNFTWDSSNSDNVGIFSFAGAGGQIMNLGVVDVQIASHRGWYIGALAGNSGASITNCYSTGSFMDYPEAGAGRVGGLVGENKATGVISDCYSTCSIGDYVGRSGGLVGQNRGVITACYATGDISGKSSLGGLVGCNYGSISDCYARGSVTPISGNFVGGVVGSNNAGGTITRCFATGMITTTKTDPGIAGGIAADWGGTVTNSFWDVETTGISYNNGGTGLTTAEMQTESTFTSAGWDFENVWTMVAEGEDYPHLRLETSTPILSVADFNGDGEVDHMDVGLLMQHWGTDNSLYDIGPAPLGDGIIDAQDLIVLAEYITAGGAALCGDANYDGVVDFLDLAELAKNWLRQQP